MLPSVIHGRQEATYWLGKRLLGFTRARCPETALFDDQGVLEAWLYVQPHTRARERFSIVEQPFMHLRLLQFEAKLQDLAKQQPRVNEENAPFVAVQCRNAPVFLNEAFLDKLIRSLCAREVSMEHPEPDLSIPRQNPDGRFCLQAYVRPDANVCYRTQFVAKREDPRIESIRDIAMDDWVAQSAVSVRNDRYHTLSSQEDAISLPIPDPLANELQKITRCLVKHVHAHFGFVLQELNLEFLVSDQEVYLTSADRIVMMVDAVPSNGPETTASLNKKPMKVRKKTRNHTNQTSDEKRRVNIRVCRSCRNWDQVCLSHELRTHQETLRDVLAKYQSALEANKTLENEKDEWKRRWDSEEARVQELEMEVDRLRERLEIKDKEQTELLTTTARLQSELTQALETIETSTIKMQELEMQATQVQEAAQKTQEHEILQARVQLETNSHQTMALVDQLREEMDQLQLQKKRLMTKYDQVCAERDELQLQWKYVSRKLTDVKEPGVAPPKRVAGGFSCYPSPSLKNVAAVVKWIVDYEARRTVIDSQRKHSTTRLKLKVRLMRALDAANTQSTRSKRRNSRRGSSLRRRSSSASLSSPSPSRRRSSSQCSSTGSSPERVETRVFQLFKRRSLHHVEEETN